MYLEFHFVSLEFDCHQTNNPLRNSYELLGTWMVSEVQYRTRDRIKTSYAVEFRYRACPSCWGPTRHLLQSQQNAKL